jgi:hypothetical protein
MFQTILSFCLRMRLLEYILHMDRNNNHLLDSAAPASAANNNNNDRGTDNDNDRGTPESSGIVSVSGTPS